MQIFSTDDGENKKYKVIYTDPPWTFSSWSERGQEKSAQNHYSCMSMADIAKLPVADVADENCILFCWVTDPLLDQQIDCIKKWGFTYKTVGFTWTKLNKKGSGPFIGLGYYTRSNPEMCLIATRGKPGRPKNRSISQVVLEPIREHSRKPDCIVEKIEQMYDGPYLEMFGRTTRPGWDVMGNETSKFPGTTTIYKQTN